MRLSKYAIFAPAWEETHDQMPVPTLSPPAPLPLPGSREGGEGGLGPGEADRIGKEKPVLKHSERKGCRGEKVRTAKWEMYNIYR
jgi:hypothetical protein